MRAYICMQVAAQMVVSRNMQVSFFVRNARIVSRACLSSFLVGCKYWSIADYELGTNCSLVEKCVVVFGFLLCDSCSA